jgi:hypothetical protein
MFPWLSLTRRSFPYLAFCSCLLWFLTISAPYYHLFFRFFPPCMHIASFPVLFAPPLSLQLLMHFFALMPDALPAITENLLSSSVLLFWAIERHNKTHSVLFLPEVPATKTVRNGTSDGSQSNTIERGNMSTNWRGGLTLFRRFHNPRI